MLDAPRMGELTMTERKLPTDATFYVAHAVANDVLINLARSLASYLTISAPDDREASGRDMLHHLLSTFMDNADFKPQRIAETLAEFGAYDPDEAESLAMDIVRDALVGLRTEFL